MEKKILTVLYVKQSRQGSARPTRREDDALMHIWGTILEMQALCGISAWVYIDLSETNG
jgi:hypothetical protein